MNRPFYADGIREIADAVLLEHGALVPLECTASIVTAEAKSSFDGALLDRGV